MVLGCLQNHHKKYPKPNLSIVRFLHYFLFQRFGMYFHFMIGVFLPYIRIDMEIGIPTRKWPHLWHLTLPMILLQVCVDDISFHIIPSNFLKMWPKDRDENHTIWLNWHEINKWMTSSELFFHRKKMPVSCHVLFWKFSKVRIVLDREIHRKYLTLRWIFSFHTVVHYHFLSFGFARGKSCVYPLFTV